jgi:Dullard-like phosphatase family protein
MSIDAYKRNFLFDKKKEKKITSQELIFGITQKDLIKQKEVNNRLNRLTGNKGSNLSMPKNKNGIIHSNSTNQLRQQNKNSPVIKETKESNYNVININVNNLIINNNLREGNSNSINKNFSGNNSKVFTKIGNDIIEGKNILNNEPKKKLEKKNIMRGMSNPKKKRKSINNKYNALSNIKEVINNLMEVTKEPIIPIDTNLNLPIQEDNNKNIKNNNNIIINNENRINNIIVEKENQINKDIDEKIMEIHFKLWEIMVNTELHAENKLGLGNQIKKILNLMETDFVPNNLNNNKIILDIFIQNQLNFSYNKIIKIFFILITYIKFLLLDFNFETTIKSNIKRLVSLINENFLLILSNQVFVKEPLQDNNSCSKLQKDFIESYSKLIKQKKIKKNYKEQLTTFCNNINKNLEIVISTVKQFSNNFFKIGYFNPIHNIFLDIFRLIDNYKVEDIANIIINNVLYFILKSSQNDKKNYAPKLVSFTPGTNPLAALGFINVPSPFLKKLPPEIETSTYTLVLDLDETLVHFFYTPSGGTFLIRPFCSQFLEEMAKIFEIVIFTAALKDYADSILDILDPNKILINYRLYRHHTSLSGITFCKDLSKIGRDLSRTLIIDNLADNFKLQPSNGILIGTWIDDMKDTQLNDLGKILKILVSKKPNDVRPIIKKFKEDMNKKMRNNMNINPFRGVDITKYIK